MPSADRFERFTTKPPALPVVYNSCILRDELGGVDVIQTPFRPGIHGFAFLNRWVLDEREQQEVRLRLKPATGLLSTFLASPFAWRATLTLRKQIATWAEKALVQPYGLCGGMAFASLDYYHRPDIVFPRGNKLDDLPTHTSPEGARLRNYLWQRSLDSLAANATTFLIWMAILHYLPDQDRSARWLGRRTLREWYSLKKHLATGEPWPVGLVGTTEDPTQNHQVVACACNELDDDTQVLVVYDMNCPGQERLIKFRFEAERFQVVQEDNYLDTRGPLQAFFCERYRANPEPPRIGWP